MTYTLRARKRASATALSQQSPSCDISFGSRQRTTFSEVEIELRPTISDQTAAAIVHRQAPRALVKSETSLSRSQEIARLASWELNWKTRRVVRSDQMYRLLHLDPATFVPTIEVGRG